MGDPFLSEVRMMSFPYPPEGWARCNGELLPIAQNEALFSLLGTTFGGDGKTDFALPDFQGQVPIHAGNGHALGEAGGSETVTLTEQEMPGHVHAMYASDRKPNTRDAAGAVLAQVEDAYGDEYGRPDKLTALHPATVTEAGASQPHDNVQPYLALTFCIALQGIFPRQD